MRHEQCYTRAPRKPPCRESPSPGSSVMQIAHSTCGMCMNDAAHICPLLPGISSLQNGSGGLHQRAAPGLVHLVVLRHRKDRALAELLLRSGAIGPHVRSRGLLRKPMPPAMTSTPFSLPKLSCALFAPTTSCTRGDTCASSQVWVPSVAVATRHHLLELAAQDRLREPRRPRQVALRLGHDLLSLRLIVVRHLRSGRALAFARALSAGGAQIFITIAISAKVAPQHARTSSACSHRLQKSCQCARRTCRPNRPPARLQKVPLEHLSAADGMPCLEMAVNGADIRGKAHVVKMAQLAMH